jgi:hypothetical protein
MQAALAGQPAVAVADEPWHPCWTRLIWFGH